ncbi:MAG: thioredoxin reductase [Candidatus Taylorbacteria bacterium CG11_big_fil_rev_8_21_14_0_20_46_11]|uniref:Thioredoxin reductase n=1 Tax=Candidatus Taylorbacteria bacterium CG11_big_fil_rev_8_21_14_0_20_46_11 TaxID=1975025 RepID=A0A2H0KCX0_9BACT|nr:MAG: thioredoxin reductase [Candidatus Taylorbacteria bacterium CG11_big_fil_rev_8_21_14_0_20_46_11]
MYDLAIIGGGPAGVSAGVYASRKRLKTIFITKDWGGQSTVSTDIQNWIGMVSIPGPDLAKKFEEHLRAYAGDIVTIVEGESVTEVTKTEEGFSITTDGNTYNTKTVLVTTGSHRRKLEVPGADRLEHKGITYCASCDGPVFADLDVAVIGGGNAAFESAAQLLAYTKSVTLLNRSADFRADPVTVKKVLAHPKMKAIPNAFLVEVKGEKMVESLVYKIGENGENIELPLSGVFAEIGSLPTTEFVAKVLELDDYKRVKIDPWTQQTSTKGIWAAGDCTNIKYHQNNIAAGDAVRALEDIYLYLNAK